MAGPRTFWVDHSLGETREAVQIRVQQMAVTVSRAPLMFVAMAVNAILTAAIGAIDGNIVLAAGWAGLVTLTSLIAFARWFSRRKVASPDYVSERGPRRLARFATLQGLIWGVGAAALMPIEASPEQAVIGLVIAAMGAGGAMVLAMVPTASMGFTAACLLPLGVVYAKSGEPLYLMLAAMIAMYILVLLAMARSVYKSFVRTIKAQVANQSLLEDLQKTRSQLLDAIASTSEGFAQFDSDGHLIIANTRFSEMLGLGGSETQPGRDFEALLRLAHAPADLLHDMAGYERWIRQTVANQRAGTDGAATLMPDGRWIELHHNQTASEGVVSTVIDLTTLKKRETELNEALIRAESADRAKSEFLALMSHELRTPLNAILGFSELFKVESFGPHADPRYKEHAQDIHESGMYLLEIINEILDLSKIESGFFELNTEVLNVRTPVDAAIRMMSERALTKGIVVTRDLKNDLPDLDADPRVMKQMLINLIGNAVKFTRGKAGVTVRGTLSPEGGIDLSVIDQGIGVAPDDMERIMSPFGQVEQSLNRREQQGTGLGLPLVKQMIALHDGHMTFRSRLGEGTTVTLHFPASRSVSATSAP